ncbi:MAG: YdeI/OmpD-associated family protein [Chitinophagales bacterium]
MQHSFKAQLQIIGVNPFVFVPDAVLSDIFTQAGKHKGPVPVSGKVNGKPFTQTLVRYKNEWRLYINTTMLPRSPKRIGETLEIQLQFDPMPRDVQMPERFANALQANKKARSVFEQLPASRRKEIVRYLANLKSEEALERNIHRAIRFLLGEERFVGRDKP